MPYDPQGPNPRGLIVRFLGILALAVAVIAARAPAQEEMPPPAHEVDIPNVYLEAMNFSIGSEDTTRLDIYIHVPYQTLSFVKDIDLFKASYDVTMSLHDSAGALMTERLWTENVETRSYDETVSRHIGNMSQKSFFLKPSQYQLSILIRDNETQKVAKLDRRLYVRRFYKNALSTSDLMLVDRLSQEGTKTVIMPNISSLVGESLQGFNIFFEAYNGTPADSGIFYLSVLNLRGEPVAHDTLRRALPPGKSSCFMVVPSQKLNAGDFRVEVVGKTIGVKGGSDSTATVAHMFTLRWKGVPSPITDIDKAIDEMQYVSDKDAIDKMKKADPETKRQMFLDFWKKKDPTPNTEVNELMEEYYARVDYANKNFSHYTIGWKTDRGMVYIIFGPPNNVERRPFDIDSKPYEIWTYYEQNREFIFIDQTGFGDYRLQSPLWDIRNRIR